MVHHCQDTGGRLQYCDIALIPGDMSWRLAELQTGNDTVHQPDGYSFSLTSSFSSWCIFPEQIQFYPWMLYCCLWAAELFPVKQTNKKLHAYCLHSSGSNQRQCGLNSPATIYTSKEKSNKMQKFPFVYFNVLNCWNIWFHMLVGTNYSNRTQTWPFIPCSLRDSISSLVSFCDLPSSTMCLLSWPASLASVKREWLNKTQQGAF